MTRLRDFTLSFWVPFLLAMAFFILTAVFNVSLPLWAIVIAVIIGVGLVGLAARSVLRVTPAAGSGGAGGIARAVGDR